MADSKRLQVDRPDGTESREGQIDALLEEGLDRYFHNRYEDAIHLWTRVLFLDRTHARARAYIDRARTALAEVQRRSEELLQSSREMLGQGRTEAARELLAEAVATSGDDVQSATLRAELERRERAQVLVAPVDIPPAQDAVPGWKWAPTSRLVIAFVGIAALGVLLAAVVLLDLSEAERPAVVANPVADSRLSTPSASEVALFRARALFSRGRLAEALQKLDGVAPTSAQRVEADSLRIEIQQLLLASVRSSSGTAPAEAIRR